MGAEFSAVNKPLALHVLQSHHHAICVCTTANEMLCSLFLLPYVDLKSARLLSSETKLPDDNENKKTMTMFVS